jgi:TolB-like protein/DNA-binding winged helix-turn-helix (wHTH) protein/Tfp pilus assembly protein PilF
MMVRKSFIFRFDDVEVREREFTLIKAGKVLTVEPKAFRALLFLLHNPQRLISKEELLNTVWDDAAVTEGSITRCISLLRNRLGDDIRRPRYIATVATVGYRFMCKVEMSEESVADTGTIGDRPDASGLSELAPLPPASHPERKIVSRKIAVIVAVLAVIGMASVLLTGWWKMFTRSPLTPPAIHSLAVLPLNNLSGDPSQEYFADGITVELITTLTKISKLRVISWTSVRGYRNTNKTLPEIAKELNVDGIIEGSLERSGDRVKVTAQLIDAPRDHNLWAASYHRDLRDILSLQEEVAAAIAREVGVALTPQDRVRLSSVRPVDPKAYQLFLRGQSFLEKFTPDSISLARQSFSQAIETDPNYGRAYAGLADTYLLGFNPEDPKVANPLARKAATKALELDDSLSDAHVAMALLKYLADWDWVGAEREFQRAIVLNPGDTLAHHIYSHLLLTLGRNQESLRESELYIKADPLSAAAHSHLGWYYTGTGEFDLAAEQEIAALRYDPSYSGAVSALGDIYRYQGKPQEALVQYEKASALAGDSPALVQSLRRAYENDGWRGYGRESLKHHLNEAKRGYVPSYYFAWDCALMGDKENVFRFLEKGVADRDLDVEINTDPNYNFLHADPRYFALLRSIGLPMQPST